MEAIKASTHPPRLTMHQWRQKADDSENQENIDLGMCLPIGLEGEKHQLRKPVVPLTDEEIQEIEGDRSLGKGYTVWRSLPMESDLDKKLKAKNSLRRTADFTKETRPEAYLPGFASRAGGPINRPHQVANRNRQLPVASQHVIMTSQKITKQADMQDILGQGKREGSDLSTSSSKGNAPVQRSKPGGVLRDSVIKR